MRDPLSPGSNDLGAARQTARDIFDYALTQCSIEKSFARNLRNDDGALTVGANRYTLALYARVAVVSIGKAGHGMAEALAKLLPAGTGGVVACPPGSVSTVPGFRYFRGGHPLPNEDSLRAGAVIAEFLPELPQPSLVFFLISGGASAMAEKPVGSSLTLWDIIETNRTLLHSGAPIAEINAIRKHLSAIKGGRMAQAAAPAEQVSLLISDVPDHSPDALASGPTMPDSSTVADCYAIAAKYSMLPRFPREVRRMFEQRRLPETPKAGDPAFHKSRYLTLLSNQSAVEAAVERARSYGFEVEVDNSCDDWDYARAADHLLSRVRSLRRRVPRACVISGGEVTVAVGEKAGTGGRNQQFALYCAQPIAGENITVLSAGTDGIDGNSQSAGAVVDGTTAERALRRGLDPSRALSQFDAFPLLNSVGDSILTGPTGTNVRDLRILLAY